MKTTHWILLGAAAVAAYLLWMNSQKPEPVTVEDLSEPAEFAGGGGIGKGGGKGAGFRPVPRPKGAVVIGSRGKAGQK